MIECVREIIKIVTNFINWLFQLKIDITDDLTMSVGTLFLSFIVFVLIIYFVLKAIGIVKGDDQE